MLNSNEFTKKTIISCNSNFDLSSNELDVIKKVTKKFKNFNSKQLVEYMHKEKAYLDTLQGENISYNFAKYINL